MFDLVADVERYPEFIPLCQRHIIQSRRKRGDSEILMTDTWTVAYQIFREMHRSRVTLDQANGRILVEWSMVPAPTPNPSMFQSRDDDSCDVVFDLSYEFATRTRALLLGGVFAAAFSRFVQAFERRADFVYGRCERPSGLHQQKLKSSDAEAADTHRPASPHYALKAGAPSSCGQQSTRRR